MPSVVLPEVGSMWVFPPWDDPDYTGPWEVVAVGVPGDEWAEAVKLKRCADPEHVRFTGIAFWPGSWVPAD